MTWECRGRFLSSPADFLVTSTAGHVYSAAFASRYNSWSSTDPLELFDADIVFEEASPENNIPQHLAYEAKGCSYLLLCLDNDREGENIAFEVIGICRPHLAKLNTKQVWDLGFVVASPCRFIERAFQLLAERTSCVPWAACAPQTSWNPTQFTRARSSTFVSAAPSPVSKRSSSRYPLSCTKFYLFQEKYGDLDSTCISYGPCQTPTLFFCVDRHNAILAFQEEPYYKVPSTVDPLYRPAAHRRSHMQRVENPPKLEPRARLRQVRDPALLQTGASPPCPTNPLQLRDANRLIEPTRFGKALLDGYMQIDFEPVFTSVRINSFGSLYGIVATV
ncbi:DNA topoisomerase III beta-1, putative [Babesia caballi]|uniref:DNA topoisomerase n=1 Tax=Babesia caballi TaxID=5871 RepID=A0AAV4LXM7_BABCB|nr:DNA topoisomerase III beta-1, putative [Babesia caballi]